MLIAMAGLPGSGKSTLAARLASALSGVVLCKDEVRAALFPELALYYSRAQDDIAMAAIYDAAAYILKVKPRRTVILDGRTFSKPEQLEAPLALAALLGIPLRVIECVCCAEVARLRLEKDLMAGSHRAGNRTPELYSRVKAEAVPLTLPRLTLDTSTLSFDECVGQALEYLAG